MNNSKNRKTNETQEANSAAIAATTAKLRSLLLDPKHYNLLTEILANLAIYDLKEF